MAYNEVVERQILWKAPFKRNNAFPLDRSSIFTSYGEMEEYAKSTKENPHSKGVPYVGQVVVVSDNNGVKVYSIETVGENPSFNSLETHITDITSGDTSLIDENKTIDLAKYYYSRTEIDERFESFNLFEITQSLPTVNIDRNKIYVIPNPNDSIGVENIYTEYIYADNKWEKIGEFKSDVDLSNYVTNNDLNTKNVILSENIYTNEENGEAFYTAGTSVQAILQNIHERIKQINSNIDSQISGITEIIPGTAIEVNTKDSAVSPEISVKISNVKNNALTIGDDSGLFVDNLTERLERLERLLSSITENGAEFITTENIGKHAITSIIYDNTVRKEDDMEDIVIENNNGEIKIALNSITNIAYGDAEDITKNN